MDPASEIVAGRTRLQAGAFPQGSALRSVRHKYPAHGAAVHVLETLEALWRDAPLSAFEIQSPPIPNRNAAIAGAVLNNEVAGSTLLGNNASALVAMSVDPCKLRKAAGCVSVRSNTIKLCAPGQAKLFAWDATNLAWRNDGGINSSVVARRQTTSTNRVKDELGVARDFTVYTLDQAGRKVTIPQESTSKLSLGCRFDTLKDENVSQVCHSTCDMCYNPQFIATLPKDTDGDGTISTSEFWANPSESESQVMTCGVRNHQTRDLLHPLGITFRYGHRNCSGGSFCDYSTAGNFQGRRSLLRKADLARKMLQRNTAILRRRKGDEEEDEKEDEGTGLFNHHQAKGLCQARGTTLMISNRDLFDAVDAYSTIWHETRPVWVGAQEEQNGTRGSFLFSDGSALAPDNPAWGAEEPNGDTSEGAPALCVTYVAAYGLDDRPCDEAVADGVLCENGDNDGTPAFQWYPWVLEYAVQGLRDNGICRKCTDCVSNPDAKGCSTCGLSSNGEEDCQAQCSGDGLSAGLPNTNCVACPCGMEIDLKGHFETREFYPEPDWKADTPGAFCPPDSDPPCGRLEVTYSCNQGSSATIAPVRNLQINAVIPFFWPRDTKDHL